MTERENPNLSERNTIDIRKGIRRVAAGFLAVMTLANASSAIERVKAEAAPAPTDPNATHPAESDETNPEDNFPGTIEDYIPAPGYPMEKEEDEYPTTEYAARERKLAGYKQELVESGCIQEYVNFCAGVMCAIDTSNGVFDPYAVKDTKKTVLKNYLSKDEVKDFGITGKGLEVIWDKDKDGKKIPALLYVGGSDWNVGLKQVQKAIDSYDTKKGANGSFLKALQENEVYVFFQTENEANGTSGRYEDGIVFFLCGKKNKEIRKSSDFVKTIGLILATEMFGNKMTLLGDDFGETDMAAVLKSVWALKCSQYLYQKSHDSFYESGSGLYQSNLDQYVESLLSYTDFTVNDVLNLADRAEKEGLVTPFAPASWEEINEVTGNIFK